MLIVMYTSIIFIFMYKDFEETYLFLIILYI